MINQAIVLCAGEGTRSEEYSNGNPKCLIDVAGKTVLARILSWLKSYEIERVIVTLHHRYNEIVQYLANNDFGMHIHCSIEEELLGTAGGVRNCINELDDKFLVVYGDVITNFNLSAFIPKGDIDIVSYHVNNPAECGIIIADDERVVNLIEKPSLNIGNLANSGIMACNRSMFLPLAFGVKKDIASDLLPRVLLSGAGVYHHPLKEEEWLFDVGTKVNYDLCCAKLSGTSNNTSIPLVEDSLQLVPSVPTANFFDG